MTVTLGKGLCMTVAMEKGLCIPVTLQKCPMHDCDSEEGSVDNYAPMKGHNHECDPVERPYE